MLPVAGQILNAFYDVSFFLHNKKGYSLRAILSVSTLLMIVNFTGGELRKNSLQYSKRIEHPFIVCIKIRHK